METHSLLTKVHPKLINDNHSFANLFLENIIFNNLSTMLSARQKVFDDNFLSLTKSMRMIKQFQIVVNHKTSSPIKSLQMRNQFHSL